MHGMKKNVIRKSGIERKRGAMKIMILMNNFRKWIKLISKSYMRWNITIIVSIRMLKGLRIMVRLIYYGEEDHNEMQLANILDELFYV